MRSPGSCPESRKETEPMRYYLIALVALPVMLSCKQPVPSAPGATGVIEVKVQLVGTPQQPDPGKRIAVLETRDTLVTDANGIVDFTVAPGKYTVRAFEIGTPGPGRPYIDSLVVVRLADTTRVTYVDCPACL